MDILNNKISNMSSFDIKYKNAIQDLANNRSKLSFNNSGPIHASIVISNIFKHSNDIVRIYANNMNGEISNHGDYLSELDSFLQSNKRLWLILDKYPLQKSEAYNKIFTASQKSNKIQIRRSTADMTREIAYNFTQETHFITGDDTMFRIEYDNHMHQALCSFNNVKKTKKIIRTFDKFFDSCPA